jgi:Pyridoxamine 5'-phosphate oxidase
LWGNLPRQHETSPHVRLCHDLTVASDGPKELNWSEVLELLAPARSYWLGTTNRDGSPHASPVWGVVMHENFYLYSERSTAKARNLAADNRALVHLESAEEVLIVHGRLGDVGRPGKRPDVVGALRVKYDGSEDEQYLPSGDGSFDVLYLLRPEKALSWNLSDYEDSQRRWILAQEPRPG